MSDEQAEPVVEVAVAEAEKAPTLTAAEKKEAVEQEAARLRGEARQRGAKDDGAAILDAVHEFLVRFISYPDEYAAWAHVLWIVHTHLIEFFETSPRIYFTSAEPGSGKTRALEVTEPLVARPFSILNASPAALFRSIGPGKRPTILFDEIDTVFTKSAASDADTKVLRGVLNAGYRRNGPMIPRVERFGNEMKVVKFSAYAALMMAGIGETLPDALETRTITIKMRRARPDEAPTNYRERTFRKEAESLKERLEDWALYISSTVDREIVLPNIVNRDLDIWEPLVNIADKAGGEWPERARVAAEAFVNGSAKRPSSLGIRLLHDIREAFGDATRISHAELLHTLMGMEETPWPTLGGGPNGGIDTRFIAKVLANFDAPRAHTMRINGSDGVKGYTRDDFEDVFVRYLPPLIEPAFELPVRLVVPDDDEPVPVPLAAAPICKVCGKPNLFSSQSVKRGTCAKCDKRKTIKEAS